MKKVVPSEDAHQSEYVCAADKRREFISGIFLLSGLTQGSPGQQAQQSSQQIKPLSSPTVATLIKLPNNSTITGN
jgi:hypothetical protein